MHKWIAGLSVAMGIGLLWPMAFHGAGSIGLTSLILGGALTAAAVPAWCGYGLKYLAVAWALAVGAVLPVFADFALISEWFRSGARDCAGGTVIHFNGWVFMAAVPMVIAALVLDRRKGKAPE